MKFSLSRKVFSVALAVVLISCESGTSHTIPSSSIDYTERRIQGGYVVEFHGCELSIPDEFAFVASGEYTRFSRDIMVDRSFPSLIVIHDSPYDRQFIEKGSTVGALPIMRLKITALLFCIAILSHFQTGPTRITS